MHNPNKATSLEDKILALEIQRKEEGILLKDQFHELYERVKPANLIKGVIHDMVKPQGVRKNFLIQAVTLTTGFLIRKYFQGKTNNKFQNLVGAVAMSGLSNAVMNNPAPFIIIGKKLLTAVFRKNSNAGMEEPEYETE